MYLRTLLTRFPDGHITETGAYRELVRTRLGRIKLSHAVPLILVIQVQRENSRFRALMAAQLSAAGGEEHGLVVPAADAPRAVSHGDEHGEEVKLSGEEASSRRSDAGTRVVS
jgi:hypothetical protein